MDKKARMTGRFVRVGWLERDVLETRNPEGDALWRHHET